MCILLKLHYEKFDVSRLFCSKVIEEKPFGGRLDPPPPLGKGRVKQTIVYACRNRCMRIARRKGGSKVLGLSGWTGEINWFVPEF